MVDADRHAGDPRGEGPEEPALRRVCVDDLGPVAPDDRDEPRERAQVLERGDSPLHRDGLDDRALVRAEPIELFARRRGEHQLDPVRAHQRGLVAEEHQRRRHCGDVQDPDPRPCFLVAHL
ncbi:MAG: hypothetical protein R3B82_10730 [Sandaracinaceae bacterium]